MGNRKMMQLSQRRGFDWSMLVMYGMSIREQAMCDVLQHVYICIQFEGKTQLIICMHIHIHNELIQIFNKWKENRDYTKVC